MPRPKPKPSKKHYPPSGIQSLIAWREQRLRGANVDATGGHTDGYLYRPGELLVRPEFEGQVHDLVPGEGLPDPTEIVVGSARILHYRFPGIRVPEVLDRAAPLIGALPAGEAPPIGPNLVFTGEQAYQGFPGDWPKPDGSRDFTGEGEDGPIVAVLDTGYSASFHQEDGLNSRFVPGGMPAADEPLDTTPPDKWRDFEAGHGTFICGIVAQEARHARLRAVPMLDSDGYVDLTTLVATIKAVGDDVDILNLSLGGFSPNDQPPLALVEAIALLAPKTAVVAAAGNAGPSDRPFWPAQLDSRKACAEKVVFAVGALDEENTDELTAYSTEPADLYAKGRWVSAFVVIDERGRGLAVNNGRQPETFDRYANWAGTSFATAAVAAEIANGMEDGRTALEVARALCDNGPTSA